MLGYGFGNDADRLVYTDDIGKKSIGYWDGNGKEDGLFAPFLMILSVVQSIVKPALGIGVSFDSIFDLSEYHFHEDGLRADHPHKTAAPYYRKQYDEYDKGGMVPARTGESPAA